jgi:sugar phosphate isomerase/epimerase
MVFYASILLEEFDAKLDSHLASGFSPEVRMTNARYMLEVTEAQLERMRARLDDRGVTVFTHGPFLGLDIASLNDHIARYSAECLERGLRVTSGLGGAVMVMHTNYSPFFSRSGFREWLGNWSARVPAVLDRADELGVTVAIENAWERQPEAFARLLDALPGERAKVCLDTGHINAFSRLPVKRWWDAFGERVIALHLHDNDGLSDDHLPPGTGIFDFPALVGLLRGRDPLPLMTLEVDLEQAIEGRLYLESLFSERGGGPASR